MVGPRGIALCSLAVMAALYVVGAVSHGVVRHIVQTLPLWFPVVLGFRKSELAKWSALPCFVFWLAIMSLIWLYLLGWANVISGTFTPVETAMTLVVGIASLCGIYLAFRWRTSVGLLAAGVVVVVFAVFQLCALKLSLLPAIAHR